MEFNLKNWLDEITGKILAKFEQRVLFVGYHGSYKRGEASETSDIDMVIILDSLELEDLKEYKKIVKSMLHSEKACGFISGKKEIENWSKSDLFQFYFETEALHGDLKSIISPPQAEQIKQSVKSSAEALYHGACHCYLFDEDIKQSLAGLFKMSFFVLQADYFLKNNEYIPTKMELLQVVQGDDEIILKHSMNKDSLNALNESEIDELYRIFIKWCTDKITG